MGAVLILVGMMFFTTGAETAMTPDGRAHRYRHDKKRKGSVSLSRFRFSLGFIITVSEPDLQVLASQVPSVPNLILILSVACGVGVFLVVSLLRMLLFYRAAAAACRMLRRRVSSGVLCPAGISRRRVRFRRRDDRPHDRAVHHGARRRHLGHPQRPPRGRRQLRPRCALVHRPHFGRHDPRHHLQSE